MKVHVRGPIIAHEEIAPGYFRMAVEAPEVARQAAPGQFVHLLCSEHYSPFLRRPLSILSAKGGQIELLYKVVGEGTEIISRAKPGEVADVVGPLGTSFQDQGRGRLLFVAGGIGIVPLVYLARTLNDGPGRIAWVYGAAAESDLVLRDEVEATGFESTFATMDGSFGRRGTLIDALVARYGEGELLPEAVCACGPRGMLAALWEWMKPRGIPGQFSLENRMGCGVGACLGCVVPKRGEEGYLRVCCDGPVFDAEEAAV